jgi:hypothetical protein
VQERHHIANRFRGEPALQHRARKTLDVLPRDAVDATLADRRRDVHALHRFAVLLVRQACAFDS